MPARISLNRPSRPERKVREGMSASHLAMVRKLPCCVCGLYGHYIQAHHLLRTGEHGMGRKSADKHAISLCQYHHDRLHAHGDEEAFLMRFGIPGRELAAALWACRNKADPQTAMIRAVERFRQEAAMKRRMG